MSKCIDMSGQKFERWTVLRRAGSNAEHCATWVVECDCGSIKVVSGRSLRRGKSKSCGCLTSEIARKRCLDKATHRMSKHPLYATWSDMKRRCHNKNHKDYPKYGKRGIGVCNEWRNDVLAFTEWTLNNGWAKGLQIDRIDNNKGYSPENCRFVTGKENCRNTRNNIWIEYGDFHGVLSELAEKIDMRASTLYNRIVTLKWDVEKAITTPVKKYKKRAI